MPRVRRRAKPVPKPAEIPDPEVDVDIRGGTMAEEEKCMAGECMIATMRRSSRGAVCNAP